MFFADSYLHRLNPFAIEFAPGVGIRWYGLAYAFAFVVGWVTARLIARKSWSLLPLPRVGDFMFAAILGVLLGARLGYALFYDPHLFIAFSKTVPFWDLLAINRGGMSSHGGMLGVIIASVWWGLRNRVEPMHLLDIGCIAATIGLGIGRLANFVNAELWGRALPPHMQSYSPSAGVTAASPPWWSIKYPQEILDRWLPVLVRGKQTEAQYAQSIATAASDMGMNAPADQLPALVIAEVQKRLDLVEQHLVPQLGGDDRFYERVVDIATNAGAASHDMVAQTIKPLLTAYYPSQIFQSISDGPILFALLALVWWKPRKPGVIVAWFLMLYGVLRIATEFYRQPDAGVPLTLGLFSRGQTLSALMILGGLACLWIVTRRNVPRIGGLFAK